MKQKYLFPGLFILTVLFFTNCSLIENTTTQDIKREYSDLYSISNHDSIQSDKQSYNSIIPLKQSLLRNEIELLKTRRTLGWVMTVPAVSWTALITVVGLSDPSNTEMDWEDNLFWGSALATAVISYYGLSLILDSNEKLSELEKYDEPVSLGLMYKPLSKTYGISVSMGF